MKKALQRVMMMGLACCLLIASGSGMAEGLGMAPATAPQGVQAGSAVTVGTTTPMTGHFGTELWSKGTSDMDVRLLLHGYGVVEKDKTPGTTANATAIKDMKIAEQQDGSRIYTMTLADGLTYNDGSPITAQDYLFTLLLTASPELKAIGATPDPLEHIRGFSAFQSGTEKVFSGLRLLSDSQFSIQVEADFSPYFYELTLLSVSPLPISVIAPGCEVADTGTGAFVQSGTASDIIQTDAAASYTPGEFSAEMLKVTLLDPQTGYEFAPRVTSGPYQLVSYDDASKTLVVEANPKFKGNQDGETPHIEKITFKLVSNDTMLDELTSGELQLINKVANQKALVRAQEIATTETGYRANPYLRSGLTFMSFACEEGPTSSVAVRRAITMCLDRDALTTEMMGGMAMRVHGYYGLGQWMALYRNFKDDQGAESVMDALDRLAVPKDTEGAKKLLESDGWTLNAEGGAYTDGVRYRQGANGLEPLMIKWVRPTENAAGAQVEAALRTGLKEIGAGFEATELPFDEMIQHYYRQEDRTYNMFFLATNFGYVFDPYYDFHTDASYQGSINKTGLRDETLTQLAGKMRSTRPDDLDGYMEAWYDYQERFIEVMPLIPLYSSIYMDINAPTLQGYDIMDHGSWALAIVYAWIGE